MVSRDKIIDALKTIREVCAENECSSCPIRNNENMCMLDDENAPLDWVLNDSEDWRAFL